MRASQAGPDRFLPMLKPTHRSGDAVSRRSGEQRDRPEPCESSCPADRPRPAGRQVEREPAGRAGEPPGKAEQPPPQRLRRDDPLTQADPGCPAGEVVSDHLHREPGPVGGELP